MSVMVVLVVGGVVQVSCRCPQDPEDVDQVVTLCGKGLITSRHENKTVMERENTHEHV